MLITPGESATSVLDSTTLIRTNSKKVISITFQDDDGNPQDIDESILADGSASGELDLEITNAGGSVLYSETYWPVTYPDNRRITHPATGRYQITFGTESGETDAAGVLLANWHIRKNSTSEDVYKTQVCDIVSPKVLSLLPRFRLLIDKTIKPVSQLEYCNLGYTDAQLVIYLQAGLARICAAQPSVIWTSLETFPVDTAWEILCRSALVFGLDSQFLFAVDQDLNSFSSQGESFVQTHYIPLQSLRNSLASELDKHIREFKLQYVRSGTLGAQLSIGLSWYVMLSTSPNGATFRGSISGGNL